MSDDDYRVPKRKNKEIRAEALSAKKFYGTEKRRPVNIVRCLQSGKILTRRTRKKLIYKIVDDELMARRDGKTERVQLSNEDFQNSIYWRFLRQVRKRYPNSLLRIKSRPVFVPSANTVSPAS